MSLKFSVRDELGNIVHESKEYGRKLDNEILTWTGPHRDEVYKSLQELPKYTRGKLKADMQWREIPQKELGSYENFGIELVLSKAMYKTIKDRIAYDDHHYEDGSTRECRLVHWEKLPYLIIRSETSTFNTVSLYNMVDRVLCQDIRHLTTRDNLKQVVELYEWLTVFKTETMRFKMTVERWGYDGERQTLYIKPEGLEEKRICELSHEQKTIINLGSSNSTMVNMSATIEKTLERNAKLKEDLTGIKDED